MEGPKVDPLQKKLRARRATSRGAPTPANFWTLQPSIPPSPVEAPIGVASSWLRFLHMLQVPFACRQIRVFRIGLFIRGGCGTPVTPGGCGPLIFLHRTLRGSRAGKNPSDQSSDTKHTNLMTREGHLEHLEDFLP